MTFQSIYKDVDYRKESSERGLVASPTNVAPSAILEGEDYGLKVSINVKINALLEVFMVASPHYAASA